MSVETPPLQAQMGYPLSMPWQMFFNNVQRTANAQSGTTANRPTPDRVGQPYYDTTLGYPVFAHAVPPDAVVWHNAAGASV